MRGPRTPLALTRLLEGRSNAAREAAVARWLTARSVPFAREPFATFEGRGENLLRGRGPRRPRRSCWPPTTTRSSGSPGANDNAASVAVLLSLLERWAVREPAGARAADVPGLRGARLSRARACGCASTGSAASLGVLSLELPGVGDSLAAVGRRRRDALPRPGAPRLRGVRAARRRGLSRRRAASRSSAATTARSRMPACPAYGLTTVPAREVPALRQFIFSPLRTMFRGGGRAPQAVRHLPHRRATPAPRWTPPRSTGW